MHSSYTIARGDTANYHAAIGIRHYGSLHLAKDATGSNAFPIFLEWGTIAQREVALDWLDSVSTSAAGMAKYIRSQPLSGSAGE